MSKYTTEVRYICENAAGYDESKGFDDIDEIIEAAVPNIFNFEFPIFDPVYKNVICSKILMHYYTREIGLETVGLWKLKLRTKLNEIMPYYNQLYRSELLKFNPLYDTDLSTTRTGNTQEESVKNETKIGESITGENRSESETKKQVGNSFNAENKNGTNKSDSTGTTVTNNENDNSGTNSITAQSTSVNDNNSNRTKSGNENYVNADNKRNYDLYSDTPQGALTGVDNESYLTNARKITDDETKVGNKDNSETEGINATSTSVNNETTSNNYTENNKSIGTTSNSDNIRNSFDENTERTVVDTTNGETNKEMTGDTNRTESFQSEGSDKFNSTETYVLHVVGKQSGQSFSKMLKEFRETFLNIDAEVINSLSDLFMNVW